MAKGLGKAIKTAREKAGMNQPALANAIGVSPMMVSRYERGENKPRLELLVDRIAPLLGLDAELLKRRYYKLARAAEASS
jgi:transcriptional regulator with XRE-family HTH domain